MVGSGLKKIIWIAPADLATRLEAATWVETAESLSRLGWDVTLVASSYPKEYERSMFKMKFVHRGSAYVVGYVAHILELNVHLLSRINVREIVLFDDAMSVLGLGLVRRLLGKRYPLLVLDIRTVPMEYSGVRRRIRSLYEWCILGFGFLLADGITAISRPMVDYVKPPKAKVLGTWPSGARIEMFEDALKERRWPSSKDVIRFVYVGAIYPERNLLAFCTAIRNVRNLGLEVGFTIVGKGRQAQALQAFVESEHADYIRVLPAIPHEQVPELLVKHHVGVLPFPDWPRFRVSSPIKLFEYMAAGVPILATRITCHTDVMLNGGYVIWAEGSTVRDFEKAIVATCQQYERLSEMGELAQSEAVKWSWDAAARKLSESLNKAASAQIARE